MKESRLIHCVRLLDLVQSGERSDAKYQAKVLGTTRRTVFRCRDLIRQAKKLTLALRERPDERSKAQSNLRRLARCDAILDLEYCGFRGTVTALAEKLGIGERQLRRDLDLCEEAIGRRLTVVRRRRKRTKP